MEWDKRDSNRSTRAKSIAARIRNCFSMLNPDGSEANEAVLDCYRGNFTPDFYPMRYAMKDPLYHQYPFVLTYLLNHVCHRYIRAGVGYVEFSVGINDLANDVIYEHFIPESMLPHGSKVKDSIRYYSSLIQADDNLAMQPIPLDSITYRFLAAFPRTQSLLGTLDVTARRKFVCLYAPVYIRAVKENNVDCIIEQIYGPSLVQGWVDKLGKIFSRAHPWIDRVLISSMKRVSEEALYHGVSQTSFNNCFVVGVDLVGDEDGNPFSPFLHSGFIKVFNKFHKDNPRFGVRLHAGEGVARESSVIANELSHKELQLNFISHMSVIAAEVLALKELECFQRNLTDEKRAAKLGYNIRIGHGLAFAKKMTSYCTLSGLNPSKLYRDIKQYCYNRGLLSLIDHTTNDQSNLLTIVSKDYEDCQKFFIEHQIVFEVCLTSNTTLLSDVFSMDIGSVNGRLLLVHMLYSGYNVLLCTDDDGIWPIHECEEHGTHISVAHEYCRSFKMLLEDVAVTQHLTMTELADSKRTEYCSMLLHSVEISSFGHYTGRFYVSVHRDSQDDREGFIAVRHRHIIEKLNTCQLVDSILQVDISNIYYELLNQLPSPPLNSKILTDIVQFEGTNLETLKSFPMIVKALYGSDIEDINFALIEGKGYSILCDSSWKYFALLKDYTLIHTSVTNDHENLGLMIQLDIDTGMFRGLRDDIVNNKHHIDTNNTTTIDGLDLTAAKLLSEIVFDNCLGRGHNLNDLLGSNNSFSLTTLVRMIHNHSKGYCYLQMLTFYPAVQIHTIVLMMIADQLHEINPTVSYIIERDGIYTISNNERHSVNLQDIDLKSVQRKFICNLMVNIPGLQVSASPEEEDIIFIWLRKGFEVKKLAWTGYFSNSTINHLSYVSDYIDITRFGFQDSLAKDFLHTIGSHLSK